MTMTPNDREILNAIHEVKSDVKQLQTKIDDSVNGRFKDNERRLDSLEANQRWLVLAIIGGVVTALLNLVLK